MLRFGFSSHSRPLEEKATADFFYTNFRFDNLYDICTTKTPFKVPQTPSRHCLTSSRHLPEVGIFISFVGTKRKGAGQLLWLFFTLPQLIWHSYLPHISHGPSDISQTPSGTLQTHSVWGSYSRGRWKRPFFGFENSWKFDGNMQAVCVHYGHISIINYHSGKLIGRNYMLH